jgi:hypothetical protein
MQSLWMRSRRARHLPLSQARAWRSFAVLRGSLVRAAWQLVVVDLDDSPPLFEEKESPDRPHPSTGPPLYTWPTPTRLRALSDLPLLSTFLADIFQQRVC